MSLITYLITWKIHQRTWKLEIVNNVTCISEFFGECEEEYERIYGWKGFETFLRIC